MFLAGEQYADNQNSEETYEDSQNYDDGKDNGEGAGFEETDEFIEHSSEETNDKDSTNELAREFADAENRHVFREPPVFKKVDKIVRH